jgi:hypothetical protein
MEACSGYELGPSVSRLSLFSVPVSQLISYQHVFVIHLKEASMLSSLQQFQLLQ